MVAGHLQEKKGFFYMVLCWADINGKRKTKWVSTGLSIKGNKKKAQKLLMETRKTFVPDNVVPIKQEMLFADFIEQWLEIVKSSVQTMTYSSYSNMIKSVIAPYFRERSITLAGLTATDIQSFYTHELKRVKASSVIHYHANIHKALKYAVKVDLIPTNPADKIERPKKERFVGSFYDANEINKLFSVAAGTKLELPVMMGAFYGLRRSEVLGLK
ncbi:MAG: tyrosine-type recombinase/integrase [Oscillospiraceae bacterium]|jgi:site-specific recombinase XerD